MRAVKKLIEELKYPPTWTGETVDLFEEFIEMRKTIGKPIKTERAIKARIKTLEALSGPDVALKHKIMVQTLEHEWQDFYALKETQKESRWDKML